jgi:hypothetical protein
MRMRWVRAAIALATVMGEERTLIAEKWYSASHSESTPCASASSTRPKHWAKASASVIPSRQGNSIKSPQSMDPSLLDQSTLASDDQI